MNAKNICIIDSQELLRLFIYDDFIMFALGNQSINFIILTTETV